MSACSGLWLIEVNDEAPPRTVQSVKSLRSHKLLPSLAGETLKDKETPAIQQSAVDAGESVDQGEGVYAPEHSRYDTDRLLRRLGELKKAATSTATSDTHRTKIIKAIKEVRRAVTNDEMQPGHLKKGKGKKRSGIDESNIVEGKRALKKSRTSPVDAIHESALEAATHPDGKSASANGGALLNSGPNLDRSLLVGKPCRRLIKGDVVSIETKMFHGDVPGSYWFWKSQSRAWKPFWQFWETLLNLKVGLVIRVAHGLQTSLKPL